MAKSRYPRSDWEWPNKAKIAISVNLAFEAFIRRSQISMGGKPGDGPDPFSLSYAEYGARSGVWRILDTMDELGLKGSMSTNGLAAEKYPSIVKTVMEAGHEIVGHGWANDDLLPRDAPADVELKSIQRVCTAITNACGVKPIGWVGPGSYGSAHTPGLLKSEGFLWNGDESADDIPYLRDTEHGPIVVMPRVNLPHNDLGMWLRANNPPGVIFEGFKDTFDQLYREGTNGSPKWTEITIHCHIGGRPTMTPTMRKCMEYAKSHDGVWFALKRDIAKWAFDREMKKK